MLGDRLCGVQDVAETQEKAGLKEECIEFYDKARSHFRTQVIDILFAVYQKGAIAASCVIAVLRHC